MLNYEELESSDLGSFQSTVSVHQGRITESLCLVSYFDKQATLGQNRSYKWWTTCDENNAKLRTLPDVQEMLALPSDWGPRTTRAVACVPADALMPYLQGPTAPKLSDDTGELMSGGAEQYRVFRFDTRWIVQYDRIRPDATDLDQLDDPCNRD